MTTILIADDNAQNLYMLEVLLKKSGYKVITAKDGSEALDLARKNPPNLILTDILMPVMDGFQLCRLWKADDQLRHVPFIFYTATFTESNDERLALNLGADLFIIKPQQPEILVQKVQDFLAEHVKEKNIPPERPFGEEMAVLRNYNEVLFHKLEKKIQQLQRNETLLIVSEAITRSGGWDYDVQTKKLYWTDGTYIIHDISRDPTVNLLIDSLICYLPEDRPKILRAFQQCVENGVSYDLEFKFITLKNNTKWIRTAAKPIFKDGHVNRVTGIILNITEHKQIEEELKARDIRLAKLTAQLPGMLYQFVRKPDGRYSVPYSSDSINQVFGCSPSEVKDDFSPILKVILPEDRLSLLESIEDSAARMVPWNHEYRVQIPGQQIRWLLGHSIPERLTTGEILWHGYNVDITDRKLNEIELQFRSLLLDASIDSIFVHDSSGKFYYVNEAACKAHGYSRAELMAMNLHDLDTPGSAALINPRIEAMKSTGSATFDVEHVHKDGTILPFEVHAGYANIQGRQVVFSVSRNISERLKAEAVLNRAFSEIKTERDKAQSYLDIAQTILLALDASGHITLLNKRGAKILEINQDKAIGLDWFDNFIPNKKRDEIKRLHSQVISGKAEMDNLVNENAIITKSGRERVILWHNSAYIDENGTIMGTLSSGEDITERKQADVMLRKALSDREAAQEALKQLNQELERRVEERSRELKTVQERLVRQEKLAIIGKLAGSVSHELRNPLGVISNSIYFLSAKFKDCDEKTKKHLNYIQDEVLRASKIVSDLLDFTRTQPDERMEVDLNEIINTTLEYLRIPANVKITKTFMPNMPALKLDPRKMQQLFNNLITNAIQAMPSGGKLTIRTISDVENVEIDFMDTGIGISPENKAKLFEPLFTTKQKGIGLGLTIVKDIVDGYKGTIVVESEVGVGTTFKIILPIIGNG
jgi:PAS domain S-box-containing protein